MKRQIVVPILNDEYKVVVCWGDPRCVQSVLKFWGYNEPKVTSLSDRRGGCYYQRGCHPVIALPCFPKKPVEIGTLAHESVHAVEHIFQYIEQDFADEIAAHSVGAIVRKVLKSKSR